MEIEFAKIDTFLKIIYYYFILTYYLGGKTGRLGTCVFVYVCVHTCAHTYVCLNVGIQMMPWHIFKSEDNIRCQSSPSTFFETESLCYLLLYVQRQLAFKILNSLLFTSHPTIQH